MDDVPLCPPYWPWLLWWLIHHPHGPDPGPIDKQLLTKLDAHFAAVSVAALSGRLSDKRAAEEIGKLAGRLASDPMPGLANLTRAA